MVYLFNGVERVPAFEENILGILCPPPSKKRCRICERYFEMKKLLLSYLFVLGILAVNDYALGANVQPSNFKSVFVGGVQIIIPPPTSEMTGVNHDNQEKLEVFVAPDSKLIASFVPIDELPKIASGPDFINALSAKGSVQVPRQGEFKDFGEKDFINLISGVQKKSSPRINSYTKIAEDGINRRLKTINLDAPHVGLGNSIELGTFFSIPNAYGLGFITPFSYNGKNIWVGKGAVLMRVKNRLLFLYLTTEYKNIGTVAWLHSTSEEWARSILKVND